MLQVGSPGSSAVYFTAPWDKPAQVSRSPHLLPHPPHLPTNPHPTPLQALKPKFGVLADKFSSKGLKFYGVDICDQQDVAMDAHVEASRVYFYKNGEKVGEYVGDSYPALEVSHTGNSGVDRHRQCR